MANKSNKIRRGDKICSTSNFTVDDMIDFVADEIARGGCRESVKKVVKETVRPCAIGGVPTVEAGHANKFGATPDVHITAPGIEIRAGFGSGCGEASDACPVGSVPPSGKVGDMITKAVGGNTSPKMATTSAWYNLVLQNGEIWTPYTSRRFLPAQYLHLMDYYKGNIDEAIARRYSLKDCFRLLDTEIEKLIFMEKHWRTAYLERSMFLPVKTIRTIFTQYLDGLRDNINDRNKCTFSKREGVYYRKIQNLGRVELWRQEERKDTGSDGACSVTVAINPTDWLVDLNRQIERAERKVAVCTSYDKALDILREYLPKVSMGTFLDGNGNTRFWLPKAWKEAFKKQGAYYTLKSLIVNRHVRYTTETGDWRRRSTEACDTAGEGLNRLLELRAPDVPAYVVHAILKKSIEQARFDIGKFLRSVRRR